MKEMLGKILGILHIIILAYAGWGVYEYYEGYQARLAETTAQIPGIESQIQVFKKKLEAIDTYKKNIENSKKSVEEVFKNIERVQRQLPAEVNDIDILDHLAKEGRLLNIPDISSTPLPEIPDGFSVTKPYNIKARGTFLQLVVFLERLSRTERIYNVQRVVLATGAEPQKGRFQVIDMDATIETYKYNQSYRESSGLDEINAQFSTPGGGGTGGAQPRRRRKRPRKEGAE